MELIVINENKLKIMMNSNDMKTYGLDENEFYCSISNTREILDRILHNTPICTGFENISKLDKILMQLYPDKNGGCELYVTKITLDEKEDDFFMPNDNEEKYLLPNPSIKKQLFKSTLLSYKFERLEYAIKAAKELSRRNYVGHSSFYQDCNGEYFIFLNTSKESKAINDLSTMFLSEFGELTNAENSKLLLLERGKCIFKENAFEQLSTL